MPPQNFDFLLREIPTPSMVRAIPHSFFLSIRQTKFLLNFMELYSRNLHSYKLFLIKRRLRSWGPFNCSSRRWCAFTTGSTVVGANREWGRAIRLWSGRALHPAVPEATAADPHSFWAEAIGATSIDRRHAAGESLPTLKDHRDFY